MDVCWSKKFDLLLELASALKNLTRSRRNKWWPVIWRQLVEFSNKSYYPINTYLPSYSLTEAFSSGWLKQSSESWAIDCHLTGNSSLHRLLPSPSTISPIFSWVPLFLMVWAAPLKTVRVLDLCYSSYYFLVFFYIFWWLPASFSPSLFAVYTRSFSFSRSVGERVGDP